MPASNRPAQTLAGASLTASTAGVFAVVVFGSALGFASAFGVTLAFGFAGAFALTVDVGSAEAFTFEATLAALRRRRCWVLT
jgi:hypothetical protein